MPHAHRTLSAPEPEQQRLARAAADALAAMLDDPRKSAVVDLKSVSTEDMLRVERFAYQLDHARATGSAVQCIEVPERDPLPIDLGVTPPDYWRRKRGVEDERKLRAAQNALHESIPTHAVVPCDAGRAARYFVARLRSHLTAVFASKGGSAAPSLAMPFEVETVSRGGRVHYSPCYFLSAYTVFGEPSSPVSGYLQPGRYVFGLSLHGKPATFDLAGEYDVPPHKVARLSL